MIVVSLFIILNCALTNSVQQTNEGEYRSNEQNSFIQDRDTPKFGEPMQNQTIAVGREAVFSCVVDNLQTYKIAYLKVDTQTILSIQTHIITKNHRMSVTHVENRAWVLRIKDVRELDKGYYMCQINTDPMKNQVGYLNVVVPPDILDYPTSTDMVVRESSNVTLRCAARGSPTPTITWRRENGEPIALSSSNEITSYNGSELSISRVNRLHMGAYLCIAQNGIPPSVSKRVMLIVHFPPMVWIQNQLVGSAIGQRVVLECQSEAFPKSINYWLKNDTIITQGKRYEPVNIENTYKVIMRLTINSVGLGDFGSFRCVSKNSLGDTDGAIKLYHIPQTAYPTTTNPPPIFHPSPKTTKASLTTSTISSFNYKNKKDMTINEMSIHKSMDDYLILKNIGGTSIENRNTISDTRDRDHRIQNSENSPSTEVQKMNENEMSSSSTSLMSSKSFTIIYSIFSPFLFYYHFQEAFVRKI